MKMKVNQEFYCINVYRKKIDYQNFLLKLTIVNKPKFVITNIYENYNCKTIFDLQHQENKKEFYPIVRLDFNQKSLNLTNKENLYYELNHSKFGQIIYILKINCKVKQKSIQECQAVINLPWKNTYSCKLRLLKNDLNLFIVRVNFIEGINRKIRSISDFLRLKIDDLRKKEFGSFFLYSLKEGDWKLIKGLNFEDFK